MQKQKIFFAFLILTFGILFLNVVSAQNYTLVAGKIYTAGFNDIVSGAQVSVVCNSYSLSTTSLNDGSYAVGFDPALYPCLSGNSVGVSASTTTLTGTASGNVAECNHGETCDADFIAIINLIMNTKPSTTDNTGVGGGGGYYYFCGNGKCDTGETAITCPRDCNITKLAENKSNEAEENKTAPTNETLSSKEPTEDTAQQTSGISRITGAVIGALASSPPLTFIVLAIIIIIVASLIVRVKRAKQKDK